MRRVTWATVNKNALERAARRAVSMVVMRQALLLLLVISAGCGGDSDCMITVDEIKNNSLIVSLLAPDVTVEGMQALSLGVSVHAVVATFSGP
jgi:hypothetical protein